MYWNIHFLSYSEIYSKSEILPIRMKFRTKIKNSHLDDWSIIPEKNEISY